jgi:hypothetical protein
MNRGEENRMVIPDNIENEIKILANSCKKNSIDVIKEALIIYKEYLNLKKEFKTWDELSDIDLISFEKFI